MGEECWLCVQIPTWVRNEMDYELIALCWLPFPRGLGMRRIMS